MAVLWQWSESALAIHGKLPAPAYRRQAQGGASRQRDFILYCAPWPRLKDGAYGAPSGLRKRPCGPGRTFFITFKINANAKNTNPLKLIRFCYPIR